MGIHKIKPNARKYSRVANNEFEFCKFTCVHLTRFDWFKNNQLLSELTHAHYREPVPLQFGQRSAGLEKVDLYEGI